MSTFPKTPALIIDDDAEVCELYAHRLGGLGFFCKSANSFDEALKYLQSQEFHLILLDLMLGSVDALPRIPELLRISKNSRLWVLTGHSSIESAVSAMRSGAAGFFSKSQPAEQICKELEAAFFSSSIKSGSSTLSPNESGLYGTSLAMESVRQNVERMKDAESTVLITGESGTGKELIARALHSRSQRRQHPFEAINCGAIPENLLESELFGHKKGSFTDAKSDRKGIFERCCYGTLFLDEIGDLRLSLQVKLLRVLQEKEIYAIGGTQPIKINTRVIAATNLKLDDEVRAGRFREDLFYRISVLRIDAPALRYRKEDVPALVELFIDRYAAQNNKQILPPSHEVMARLVAYDWPGNVRELQNALERAIVLSEDGRLRVEDLFPHSFSLGEGASEEPIELSAQLASFRLEKIEFEKTYLKRLLKAAHGNISEAARLSGQHRPQLYRLMQKYSILPENL